MASIRRLSTGKWQVSFESARTGIRRSRRNFATRQQAREYAQALEQDAHRIFCGHRQRRLFGDALARYLQEDSTDKRSHQDDISNARCLRWPAWDPVAGMWRTLEHAPLDPAPGELSVPAVLELWVRDQLRVLRRSRLNGEIYQLREDRNGEASWYFQPEAEGAPVPRSKVSDASLLDRLEHSQSRGPYASGTLRTRQLLVARVLRLAWKSWDWAEADLSGRIELRAPAAARRQIITPEQLSALLCVAEPAFGELILGAAWTGLRRGNLCDLRWDHVTFSAKERGCYWIDRHESKNGDLLWFPMSERVEQLLRERRAQENGAYVFHQGDGTPWGDFRKAWARCKREAGVAEDVRWHDLRATWATGYATRLTTAQLQALGGWKTSSSAERYVRLQRENLGAIVNNHSA